jgi:hypothetical protein
MEAAVKERVRPSQLRLEIASVAPGGDGLAHVMHGNERRAVFVPRSAPGDVLEAEVDWSRKPARARLLRLIEASPLRASPPCPIAERCGGCDLMHLALPAQMDVHRDIVVATLAHALQRATTDVSSDLSAIVTHGWCFSQRQPHRARFVAMYPSVAGSRSDTGKEPRARGRCSTAAPDPRLTRFRPVGSVGLRSSAAAAKRSIALGAGAGARRPVDGQTRRFFSRSGRG